MTDGSLHAHAQFVGWAVQHAASAVPPPRRKATVDTAMVRVRVLRCGWTHAYVARNTPRTLLPLPTRAAMLAAPIRHASSISTTPSSIMTED